MSIASSLIASIDAALHDCAKIPVLAGFELKIGLRNLKSLLFCVRNLGDDDARLIALFGRIQIAVADGSVWEDSNSCCLMPLFGRIQLNVSGFPDEKAVDEVHCLAKETMDFLQMRESVSLTPEDIVGITDCFLNNAVDFRNFSIRPVLGSFLENLDAIGKEISSSKNFLLFAMRSGTTVHELENLFHFQTFAISAAFVFVRSETSYSKWHDLVELNCARMRRMATYPLYQAYTQVLRSSKLHMNAEIDDDALENVIDSLASVLWDVMRLNTHDHVDFLKDQLKLLYERLRFLRSAKYQPDGKIRNQIGVLVCDAGVLIFSLYQTDVQVDPGVLSDLLQTFDNIVHKAQVPGEGGLKFSHSRNITKDIKAQKLIRIENLKCEEGIEEGEDLKVEKEVAMQSKQLPKTIFPLIGFKEDELTSILDQLSGGISKHLRMVAISGMAGIGKTTLALKVFNIASAMYHFQAFAWCTFSQVLDKKKVLVELLNQIHPSPSYSDMNEDDLANKLRQSLKGKRYLILLDDVWTNEAWNSLAGSFPDDFTQSRIILTSRQSTVAPRGLLVNGKCHLLRLREDHECLEILRSKLFLENAWPLELAEFGTKIAAMCKGLPLTTTIVAGLLATTKQQDWEVILYDLSSGVASGAEQCNNSLELSYNHLPCELQPCFLYFGAYPEDHLVPVRRLLQLWMAEGFVKDDGLESIADVARGYLNGLIDRNLVMLVKKGSISGAKTCRVHDAIHDFCVKKAKQESFFHLLLQRYDQLSSFNEPCSLHRLCINAEPIHFLKSRLFCPQAHSILFFSTQVDSESYFFDMSSIIQICKLVEVLDIGQICLSTEIPSEMQPLTRLKYLSFGSRLGIIPLWIGKLSNLETFIVHQTLDCMEDILLPDTFWNLQKLRYFHMKSFGYQLHLPIDNLENSLVLLELETLVGVVFDSSLMEKQLKKFPNVRRLKCEVQHRLETAKDFIKIVIPEFLSQLESLTIGGRGKLRCDLGCTENLRKVVLRHFKLSRDEVEVIGNLPSLEILKLQDISFSNGSLEMEEGEFSKLRVLEFFDNKHSLMRWTTSDEQLPSLEKLVLRLCDKLEEIPSCLEDISTLETIEVYMCSTHVQSLVRDIEKVYSDFGNHVEIRIRSK